MLFGGNWNNGANCGSRASNWNTAFSNSSNNIGGRAVCVCVTQYLRHPCYGLMSRLFHSVSRPVLLRETHFRVRNNAE